MITLAIGYILGLLTVYLGGAWCDVRAARRRLPPVVVLDLTSRVRRGGP